MRAPLFLPLVLALALPLAARPAWAGLTEAELRSVTIAPPPGARIDVALPFRDGAGRPTTLGAATAGRPTLLMPVDYLCRSTCGPALAILADVLERQDLRPGTDYRVVLVGIGTDAGPEAGRAFAAARLAGTSLEAGTAALTGDDASVGALTGALGYRYVADPENGAFAHPDGLFVLTGEGRVSRVLSSLALNPTDLRLALVEAGEGRIGGLSDQLALLCYGFDAVHGIYSARIGLALKAGAAATLALMGLGLWWLTRRTGARAA